MRVDEEKDVDEGLVVVELVVVCGAVVVGLVVGVLGMS